MVQRKSDLLRLSIALLILLSILGGCNFPIQEGVSTDAALPTPTAGITLPTQVNLSTTPPVIPSQLPNPTVSEPPLATLPNQQVAIYLVALNDPLAGQVIGCGDSLVPVMVEIPATEGVLRAALNALLGVKEAYYGQSGLYNSLYQSSLSIDDIRIESEIATIELSGSLKLGGVCDNPRFEGQLEATARQFSTVKEVRIFVNGVPLEELLSLK